MRFCLSLLCVALLAGCASNEPSKSFAPPTDQVPLEQVQVKRKFDTVSLTKENFAAEAQKCISFLKPDSISMRDSISKFSRANAIVGLGHQSSSRRFIFKGTTGFCLEYSANGYPIYAVETFMETVNPTGIPPDITNDWYTKIAKQIAREGLAKVAYVTEKGTAFVASYWSDPSGGIALNYSSTFKKVGEWETAQYDFKFSDPSLRGVSETERGSAKERSKQFPLAKN